jgi:hypothetical protein
MSQTHEAMGFIVSSPTNRIKGTWESGVRGKYLILSYKKKYINKNKINKKPNIRKNLRWHSKWPN